MNYIFEVGTKLQNDTFGGLIGSSYFAVGPVSKRVFILEGRPLTVMYQLRYECIRSQGPVTII